MNLNYTKCFKEQKELIESQLMPGEEYKRCLDKESDPKYYNESWVLTSESRIWSLWFKRWLTMSEYKNKPGQLYLTNTFAEDRKVSIHHLVNHYFGDRTAETKYGAEKCDTHHGDGDRKNNRADNLHSTWRPDHKAITAASRSGKFGGTYLNDKGESISYEGDSKVQDMFRLVHDVREAGGKVNNYVEYSKDGSERIKTEIKPLMGVTAGGKQVSFIPLLDQPARLTFLDENGEPERVVEGKLEQIPS